VFVGLIIVHVPHRPRGVETFSCVMTVRR